MSPGREIDFIKTPVYDKRGDEGNPFKERTMSSRALPAGVLWPALIALLLRAAQFTPQEIAWRDDAERFLLSAAIVDSAPVGEGVTHPFRLTLRSEDIARRAIWKNVTTAPGEVPDEWRFEVAAYRMDKLLGLGMVPPTVEREFRGVKGSLQLWVDTAFSLLDIVDKDIPIPDAARESIEDRKYLTRAFDSLIANEDRTQQNVRYTTDWRTILIDHSRAFRSDPGSFRTLYFGRHGTKKNAEGRPFLLRRLPRTFADKLRSLTFEGVRAAEGPYLTEAEVRAVIARRDLLLRDIEESTQEAGGSGFLYDR